MTTIAQALSTAYRDVAMTYREIARQSQAVPQLYSLATAVAGMIDHTATLLEQMPQIGNEEASPELMEFLRTELDALAVRVAA